jgi:parallel beta-helix repeat protein
MKKFLKSFLLLTLAIAFTSIFVPKTHAASFIVDSLGDTPDPLINGICDDGGGFCTLRAAVQEVNAAGAGIHSISISVAGTITLGSALPSIIERVGISGATAPGFSANTGPDQGGANPAGFTHNVAVSIAAPDTLTDIFHFSGSGADLSAVTAITFHTYDEAINVDGADSVSITTCNFGMNELEFIGGTQNTGVIVQGGATGTIIGLDESGNIFMDHDDDAIIITGGASGISIEGNNIGINLDSSTLTAGADTNASDGIFLTGASSGTIIHFNRIASNGAHGINIDTATGSIITANIIGAGLLDVDRGNTTNGINILSTGTSADRIGTDGDGAADATEGNTIVGNGGSGIVVDADSSTELIIAGNFIGETRTPADLGNDIHGIFATGAFGGTGARIGSDNDGTSDTIEGNVVSNNGSIGIYLDDTADSFVVRDNVIDDNLTRGIQNGTAGIAAGPFGTIIDRNTITNHGPGGGTNGVGIENGTYTSFTRNTLIDNRVGFSIDFFNGATATVGGATPADGNDFSGSSIDGAHIHDTNASAVLFHNNTFGANGANLVNLSLRSHNTDVGGVGFGNTFHEPLAGGRHIEIIDEGVGTDPDGNKIDVENTFMQPAAAPFFMAIDLFADGPTAVQNIFPNVGDPNQSIDVVESLAQTIGTLTITGTSEASAVLIVHSSPTTAAGIAENYLTTATATVGGTFSIDLTGFATFGDIVSVSQRDPGTDDSSEFVSVLLVAPVVIGGGGTARTRDDNVMVTQDFSAAIGLPSELIQGVNINHTTPLTGLSFTSLDKDRDIQIEQTDPVQEREFSFTAFFEELSTFLTAMIWGENTIAFSGSGSQAFFTPLEPGEYSFQATGTHDLGSNSTGTFIVTVEAPKNAACTEYESQNLYWQSLKAIVTCDNELQEIVTGIAETTKSNIPAECLTKSLLPPPQVSCLDKNTCVNPDYAMLKKVYLEALQPSRFDEIFPSGNDNILNLIENFISVFEEKEKGETDGFEGTPENACGFDYRYYDFPGKLRFGIYNVTNVLMVYELRNIFSGLISDQLLAPYLNLIRSHAVIATFRTYQDSAGLFWLLADEKELDSNHVDVRDDDIFKPIFSNYANGYSLEEALIAAIELGFVSNDDLDFLRSRVMQIKSGQASESPNRRYLLPTSDIQKIDLIALVDSVIQLSKIFPSEGRQLLINETFSNDQTRRMIAPYVELGILTSVKDLEKGIPRAEVFTFFYRLQKFNYFLKDEIERFGLELGNSGQLNFEGESISKENARELFQVMVKERFAERDDLRKVLEIGTRPVIEDFWLSLNRFLSREDEPFPSISKIIFSSKDPVLILGKLKELLDR